MTHVIGSTFSFPPPLSISFSSSSYSNMRSSSTSSANLRRPLQHAFFLDILSQPSQTTGFCFVFVHNELNKTSVIYMSHFFTVWAKSVIAVMFLFGVELVSLATFVTLFKLVANTFRSSPVRVITVLSVKLSITSITIDFCCHIGREIRTGSVSSSAAATILAPAIVFRWFHDHSLSRSDGNNSFCLTGLECYADRESDFVLWVGRFSCAHHRKCGLCTRSFPAVLPRK